MVSVPVRFVVTVLAATLKFTAPFPLPELPAVIVIQETLLTDVQVHPVCVVTETVPLALVAGAVADVGEIV